MTQPAKRTVRVHSPAPGSAPPREGATRFTVITSTYNASAQLGRTADSIRQQTHHNIQWIVVDGASTDDTSETVRACSDVVTTYISEPDRGIYDAWNKALPLIDGDWVLFLGAGDVFDSDSILGVVSHFLSSLPPRVTIAYGDVNIIDPRSGAFLRVHKGVWRGVKGPWVLGHPYAPHQEGAFYRNTLFDDGFRYDKRMRVSADTELMMRELLAGNGVAIQLIITRFNSDGVSSSQTGRLRIVLELIYVNWKVGISFRRPFYQAAIVLMNIFRHTLLKIRAIHR